MKYPIGIQTFEQIITEGYVYVDKTDMVYSLANETPISIFCRPRCFGKTILLSTLKSYFLGRKELFKGLKIEKLESEWKTYPVFHLNLSCESYIDTKALRHTLAYRLSEWERLYGISSNEELDPGDRFADVLKAAHEQTGLRCVVLIDGYDKPLLDSVGRPDMVDFYDRKVTLMEYNLFTLLGFYATFKTADPHTHFVFLTGVSRFYELNADSCFNQPAFISLDSEFATLCGFTEQEVDQYFHEPIQEMAEEEGCSYDEMRNKLQKRYGGYRFSDAEVTVSSPINLLNAFDAKQISDYWFAMGIPSYLRRIHDQFENRFDEFTKHSHSYSNIQVYNSTFDFMKSPLPLIYQGGLLTIKSYDSEFQSYKLGFPNNEIKRRVCWELINSYFKSDWAGHQADDLVWTLDDGLTDKLEQEFKSLLDLTPEEAVRANSELEREHHFRYPLFLIFNLISAYHTYAEKEQSQGRLDCVVETPKYVYIFEFKLGGKAAAALKQIRDKGYATEYLASGKKIYKVGICISSKTGTVSDWGVEE